MLIVLSYSVYFDITKGTLPGSSLPVQQKLEDNETEITYKEIKIEAGDTLLSVIEREEGKLTQPIQTIMGDFQKLNKGISPHELQIGKTYKFPSY